MRATDREYQEISEDYEEARRELKGLFKVGTNKARVNDLLKQATRNLEKGDYDRARLNIAKAQSTARTSTQTFIGNLILEVRNIMLFVRTIGGDISLARPMLITAKKLMNGKRYRKAAVLTLQSVEAIKNIDDRYRETLMVLVKVKYNYVLVESFGLDMTRAKEPMDKAFSELKARNFGAAENLAAKARREVRAINRDFMETSALLTVARFAEMDAREAGADVTEAHTLLEKGIQQIERNEFEVARELLRDAIDSVPRVVPEDEGEDDFATFVSKKKRTAKEAIDRTKGMGADVSDAEMQFAVGWKRQQEGDFEGALKYYSRAIDEAIDAGKAMAWKGGGP